MSTLRVDAIRHNSATSDAITTAADGTCTAKLTSVGGSGLSHRNLLINGAMTVAQRGTTSTSQDGYLHVDRWRTSCGTTGNSITTSQDTDSPVNFKNSLKYTVTSAAGSTQNSSTFEQMIEGQNMSHLNWGTSDARAVVLSFYVKCSVANLVLGGAITNNFNGQTYPFTYTTNSSANTWTRHTVYIPGPTSGTWATNNSAGMRVIFNLGSASARLATEGSWANTIARGPTGAGSLTTVVNSTFFLTGCQLEVGDTATTFEHRSAGDELKRCQRYYQQYVNPCCTGVIPDNGSKAYSIGLQFQTRMRAVPTLTITNAGDGQNVHDGQSGADIASLNAADRNVDGASIYLNLDSDLGNFRPGVLGRNDQTTNTTTYKFAAEL